MIRHVGRLDAAEPNPAACGGSSGARAARPALLPLTYPVVDAGVAELVDAPGLGPGGPSGPWRFDPSRPHSYGRTPKTSSTGARSFGGGSLAAVPRCTSETMRSPGASPSSSRAPGSFRQAGVRQYDAIPRAVAPSRIA